MRLKAIEIQNIKNIKKRKIDFSDESSIFSIQGENGTGKSAFIDALYIMQKLMCGEKLEDYFGEYINVASSTAYINITFEGDIRYSVRFEKKDDSVKIVEEMLSTSVVSPFLCFKNNKDEQVLPEISLSKMTEKITIDLLTVRELAFIQNTSAVFSDFSMDIWEKLKETEFTSYCEVIESLRKFATEDLFILHDASYEERRLGFNLKMDAKDYFLSLDKPMLLDKVLVSKISIILEQINILLSDITDMKLVIKDYGEQCLDNGEIGNKIEILSRGNNSQISVKLESRSVLRIISILGAAVNSRCLVIDDLDCGLSTTMLDKLIKVLSDTVKQLVFTSLMNKDFSQCKMANIG